MYVYNVEEFGKDVECDGNYSSESVDNDADNDDAEYDAEPEPFADSDAGVESGTESQSERKPEAGAESERTYAEPDSDSKPQPPEIVLATKRHKKHKDECRLNT